MNFIEDVLERFPAARPAVLAIGTDGHRRVWHFGELIAMSAGVSGALAARGVGRGDVVMTLVGNRIEWLLTLLACWRMGAVALPLSTQLRADDVAHRAAASNAKLCVAEDRLVGLLPGSVEVIEMAEFARILDEDLPQETPASVVNLAPDDPALIVFTSGTTGAPRGAVHGNGYLLGQRTQATMWLGADKGELVWCTTATGWSKSARNVFVAPWLCEAVAMLVDGRFNPDERLALIEAERVDVLCQAPTEYRMLAKEGGLDPLTNVRRMVSAGEPLNPGVIATFRDELGVEISDGYGQTETGQVTGNLVGEPVRDGSMGCPLPGIQIRVGDGNGDTGELLVQTSSCPTFFCGYLGDDYAAHQSRLLDGEWWRTGDVVRESADGYLFYEGRNDDLISSSGYRIGPFEVESALLSHPAVAEAAAVAHPDAERGSVVRAIVVLREGVAGEEMARELQEHVKARTAPYKFPRIVEFAEELPKTASGKIKRAELRGE